MANSALLIIDVQNDYFPGGRMSLPGADEAAANIGKILDCFRKLGLEVIHVQHVSVREGATFFLPDTQGVRIHDSVRPFAGEKVIVKHHPNSFLETELGEYLSTRGLKHLVICGMMTFMCVDATTRAAKDMGYACTLLHDCTAAPPAEFAGVSCSAEQVRAAVTRALSMICEEVVAADELVLRLSAA